MYDWFKENGFAKRGRQRKINQQMKTTPDLLGNNVSKTYFTYKNKQRIIFSTIFRVMYGNISYDS